MKYAKELDEVIESHPFHERIFLIKYRSWKKKNFLNRLYLSFKLYMTPKKLLDINLKTMYKLCKRFEKRGLENDAKHFYTMISKITSSKASMELLL
jgi:hypothetical protein